MLDFGCGAGATLRHFLPEAEFAEFWGADIDTASIAWLQAHLSPPLRVMRNRPEPPLGLEHGTFDLIWALSVFTHLTDRPLEWLVDLHQLLKPGGLLAATYMGRWNGEMFTGEPWDEDRVGMNVLRRDQGWDDGGPIVLMSDWWVREHWGARSRSWAWCLSSTGRPWFFSRNATFGSRQPIWRSPRMTRASTWPFGTTWSRWSATASARLVNCGAITKDPPAGA